MINISTSLVHMLTDAAALPSILVDVKAGRLLDCNHACRQMLGISGRRLADGEACDAAVSIIAKLRELSQHSLAQESAGTFQLEIEGRSGRFVASKVAWTRLGTRTEERDSLLCLLIPEKSWLSVRMPTSRTVDELTGLATRAVAEASLLVALTRCESDNPVAVMLVCLSRLRRLSEIHGQVWADRLLQLVAKRLRPLSDNDRTLLARISEDCFALVVDGIASPERMVSLGLQSIQAFDGDFNVGEQSFHLLPAVGIAFAGSEVQEPQTLIQYANIALSEAQRAAAPAIRVFNPTMLKARSRIGVIESRLGYALRNGAQGLSLSYQPILDLRTGALRSTEALLRWTHPELGVVSPAEFVPIAEDCGLMEDLGEWALNEACDQLMRWEGIGSDMAPETISVNVSRIQLMNASRLESAIQAALHRSGMPAGRLKLEITESDTVRQEVVQMTVLQGLHASGVRLAMDDFGTGVSSLGRLGEFPFDSIKIDKTFTDALGQGIEGMAVLQATVVMIENLGMTSVAEGIESAEQLAVLQSLGCRDGQGYYFSPPLTSSAFHRWRHDHQVGAGKSFTFVSSAAHQNSFAIIDGERGSKFKSDLA